MQIESPASIRNPRAFLFAVAANLARDRQRHGRRWRNIELNGLNDERSSSHTPASDRVLEECEQLRRLEQAVAGLPVKCQSVFIMHRIEGLTYREVGRRMSLSETMVRKYAARAVAHCREYLSDEAL
jgi:RNA polymerase sigma-70 factor (ECF subfamily)